MFANDSGHRGVCSATTSLRLDNFTISRILLASNSRCSLPVGRPKEWESGTLRVPLQRTRCPSGADSCVRLAGFRWVVAGEQRSEGSITYPNWEGWSFLGLGAMVDSGLQDKQSAPVPGHRCLGLIILKCVWPEGGAICFRSCPVHRLIGQKG